MLKLIFKLSLSNIVKNRQLYLPYSLAVITNLSIFFIFTSLMHNPSITTMIYAEASKTMLGFGSYVVGIAALVIILYANSFVMKNRSKELGLYHILGLEKKHLHFLILVENGIFFIATTAISLLFGTILDRFMYMLLLRIMRLPADFSYHFSLSSIGLTCLVALAILLVIIFVNGLRLGRLKTIDLLREQQKGEKKARFLLPKAILGFAILGCAYYMAWTVKPRVSALSQFFFASIMVIIATYILFQAGTLVLLKLLQKRESFYYRTNNMITISNLLFRMRKNAIGLASICILSTMTLVTVSATTSLFADANHFLQLLYPHEVNAAVGITPSIDMSIESLEEKLTIKPDNITWTEGEPYVEPSPEERAKAVYFPLEEDSHQLEFQMFASLENNHFEWTQQEIFDESGIPQWRISLQTPQAYTTLTGEHLEISDDEVYIAAKDTIWKAGGQLSFGEKKVRIKGVLDYEPLVGLLSPMMGVSRNTIIVLHPKPMQFFTAENITNVSAIKTHGFHFTDSTDEKKAAGMYPIHELTEIAARISDTHGGHSTHLTLRTAESVRYMGVVGSVFFIGIFLGLVFITGTVLIIYYKQISEGFEDRRRFQILKKVGLDDKHVRSTIRRQIITVFFLPIVMAILHIVFAYRMIEVILVKLMGLVNEQLVFTTIAGSCVIFFIFYILVYFLTATSYKRIAVKRRH